MKTDRHACPGPEELKAYRAEQLDEERLSEIELHLNHCGNCRKRLSSIGELLDQFKFDPRHAETVLRPEEVEASPPSRTAIRPGTIVGGYEIMSEIARGGMGIIYKARHPELRRTVALKMVLGGENASQDVVDRFLIEARAAAKLEHKGIVSVYEVGQYGKRHYFVMQFVDGTSLAKKLESGRMKPAIAVKILRQIAMAVQYAHENGIVHRDLKPGNVLLTSKGTPRITDFGLAKQLDSSAQLSATGDVLGTPSFMAPEQASGQIRQIGPRTDVYGLGAILYAMLAGRPPFQAETALVTLQQVMEQEPVALRTLRPKLDANLEAVCLKCLRKSPEDRYPSAQALVDDLDRLTKAEPVSARRRISLQHLVRWCRRDPRFVISTVISLLLLAALVVVSIQSAQQHAKLQAEIERLSKMRDAPSP